MRIMLGVKVLFQLGWLMTLTCQHFVANQTRWMAFIVFRYEIEIILQKTFIKCSLFGMTRLVFLIELPLFISASQCCKCLCFNIICSRLITIIVRFFNQLSIDYIILKIFSYHQLVCTFPWCHKLKQQIKKVMHPAVPCDTNAEKSMHSQLTKSYLILDLSLSTAKLGIMFCTIPPVSNNLQGSQNIPILHKVSKYSICSTFE